MPQQVGFWLTHLRCGKRIVNSWKARNLRSLEDVMRSPSTTSCQKASRCPARAGWVEAALPAACSRGRGA